MVIYLIAFSSIFSQPSTVYHHFTNEYGNGTRDEGEITAWNGNHEAPWTHEMTSQMTGIWTVSAIDNASFVYNGQSYKQKFVRWATATLSDVSTLNFPYGTYTGYTPSIGNNITHTAHFHSLHNITIASMVYAYGDLPEDITINYQGQSSPHTTPITRYSIEDTWPYSITFQNDFWYDNIHFYVNQPNPMVITFNPNDSRHPTVRMTHTGYPEWPASTPRNLTFAPANQNPGANVRLTWSEHPNQFVSKYEIWRSSPTYGVSKIGEVNRGTTSFVDNQYFYSIPGGAQPEGVYYDVRAFYSNESTTSPADFVYTKLVPIQIIEKGNADNSSGVSEIKEYSITNYPNPFNPVTKIEYQVPNAGHTTVKVYSTLGKEVVTLVDEYKDGGKYTTEFNASDLPSGVYFYELRSGEFVQMKKMLLDK